MYYRSFIDRCPAVAMQEMRSVLIPEETDGIPPGQYILTEAYCDEANCDCRRVMFNIMTPDDLEVIATIAYGWETKKFYAKWFGGDDPDIIKGLQGPVLNLGSEQGPFAKQLLKLVKNILRDKEYVERIKKHYQMFKAEVKAESKEKKPTPFRSNKIGRNEPCPCGSGKKYKKCCG